jgi:hypothetical protein
VEVGDGISMDAVICGGRRGSVARVAGNIAVALVVARPQFVAMTRCYETAIVYS